MPSSHDPKQNHLLAALPAVDYARLLPDLEFTPMPLAWLVYESGVTMDYVYFPPDRISTPRPGPRQAQAGKREPLIEIGRVSAARRLGQDAAAPGVTEWSSPFSHGRGARAQQM
jgi:hypothetical protein